MNPATRRTAPKLLLDPVPQVDLRDLVERRTGVGVGVARRETGRFIRGAGQYVDDIKLPEMAYAAFVRSPVAHAYIRGIDATEARALPGVIAICGASDLDVVATPIQTEERVARVAAPLARDKVRYVGESVAIVIAEDRYVAEDAAELVMVDYDLLPVVIDPEDARRPDAPILFEHRDSNILEHVAFKTDGVDDAFARADRIVSGQFRSARITACPIEPRGVLARPEPGGGVTVWTSTAGIHPVRAAIAQSLGVSENRVEVIAPDVGGSFGGKNSAYSEELAVAAAAKYIDRPVKWAETRIEHLTTTRHGRDQRHSIEAAVTNDGRVLALRDVIVEDEGAALSADAALAAAYLYVPGPYDIQEYQFDAYSIATNKVSHGALRGIGKADALWVIDRLMDRIARELGLDPADVRKRNFVPEDAFPYVTATGARLDSGRYETALNQALELIGYDQLREEQRELRAKGVWRGIGVAFVIEPTSATRRNQGGAYGACRLRMEPTGRVTAFPNIGQQGQGHQTSISQIVAEPLGITLDDVEVIESGSSQVPYGTVTGSSRSSVILMPAVHEATRLLRDKILAIASHNLGVPVEELELADRSVRTVEGSSYSGKMTLPEITRIAHTNVDKLPPDTDPALEVIGFFKNPNIVWDHDEKGRRNEFAVYPYDAGVIVVDVDVDTGKVDIVKYASVHDCGKIINPRIVKTQHTGCIVHGIGAALYEELRYSPDGNPESSTFMDYLIPTANEIPPELLLGHLETPTPYTPLGAKGAGETGMLTVPPALGNAIEDALRPLGVQVSELPYSAVRVFTAIQEARARQDGAVADPH